VLISNGRLREGVALVERVAKQTQAADAYLLAGRTLFRLNEFERARDSLETATRLNPNLPGVYTAWAWPARRWSTTRGPWKPSARG